MSEATFQGYTCDNCGMFVALGINHSCTPISTPSPPQFFYNNMDPLGWTEDPGGDYFFVTYYGDDDDEN